MELQHLNWEQKQNELFIIIPINTATEIKFPVEKELINFLAGNIPKVYFLYIELDTDQVEQTWFIDLNLLKPLASKENSLKITVGKTLKRTGAYAQFPVKGKYCIGRGESYHERFLSETGWQHQRNYFDLRNLNQTTITVNPVSENNKAETIHPANEKNALKNKSENPLTGSKLKQCIHCGELLPGNIDVCFYCKKSQNAVADNNNEIDISI